MVAMARLSVTIKPELKEVASEIAKENKVTASKLVSQCLEELAQRRKEDLMIQYYKDMASEHKKYAKKSQKVIQKIVASWGD